MTLYTASQIAEVVGLNKKHVWRDVRYHGIEPGKVRGVLVLDKKQLDAYMKAKAVKPQPVSRPTQRANKQKAATKNGITLQTEDQVAKAKARQAIMQRRLLLGIVHEEMTPYPVAAVGTPEQVAVLREKWA